jgi:pimeloyl-ACP methyl ester carboxylesterase
VAANWTRGSASRRVWRTGFSLVDGVFLHFAEMGRRKGRPLVLLHGLGDSHRTWRHVAPLLAQDRWVLALDLAGHGRSARPDASYSLDWHSQLATRWAQRQGLDEIDVVAHSFGGGVAQMMLLEKSPRIRRLVLVAPGGLGRDVHPGLRLASIPRLVEWIGQPFMKAGTKMMLATERDAHIPFDIDDLARLNAEKGTARAFARTIRGVIGLRGQHTSFYQRAHLIESLPPIRVFWGERDSIIPARHADDFARVVEGVSVRRFARCGHYLHRDDPERFVTEAKEFLDSDHQPSTRYRGSMRRA